MSSSLVAALAGLPPLLLHAGDLVACVIDVRNTGNVRLYNVSVPGAILSAEGNSTESNMTTVAFANISSQAAGQACTFDVLPRNGVTPPCLLTYAPAPSQFYEGYAEVRAVVTAETKCSHSSVGTNISSFNSYHVSLPYPAQGEPELRLRLVPTAPGERRLSCLAHSICSMRRDL